MLIYNEYADFNELFPRIKHRLAPSPVLMVSSSVGITGGEDSAPKINLIDLPVEILLQIADCLTYPDALSLKICHPKLRDIVAPTLNIVRRVEWLVDRANQSLSVPHLYGLDLGSDHKFVKNYEIEQILSFRRFHRDCVVMTRRQLESHLIYGSEHRTERSNCIRCYLSDTGEKCVGVVAAMDLYNDWNWDTDNSNNILGAATHYPTSQPRSWKGFLVRYLVRPCISIVSTILAADRARRRCLFVIWQFIELSVLVALIAHFVLGIDLDGLTRYVLVYWSMLEQIGTSTVLQPYLNRIPILVKR